METVIEPNQGLTIWRETAGRRGPTLMRRIVLFVLAVALPLLALAGGAIWQQHLASRARAEDAFVERARAMALRLDREFLGAEYLLRILGGSDALASGDMPRFWSELRNAVRAGGAQALSLTGPDGRVRLSTDWAPGQRTDVTATGPAAEVLASGNPAIGNLFTSPVDGTLTLAVAIPVDAPPNATGPPVRQALAVIMPRQRLLSALTEQNLPEGARAALLDRNRVIVARSFLDAESVGKRPSADTLDAMTGETGMVRDAKLSREGSWIVLAYARAPLSGFTVAISIPVALFEAPLRAALLPTAGIGAALLACSLVLGAIMARGLARALRRLGASAGTAAGTGSGEAAGTGGRRLREMDELAAALARRSAEREQALAELRALFDGSPVGLIRADAGGRVSDANDAFLAMVGLTRDDLRAGRIRWDDLTPPEWIGRDEAAITEAVRRGGCTPYQKEYVRPDGVRVPVLMFFVFLDRNSGGGAAFVIDLSSWSATEAALARAHEQMRLAIRAARMFFWDFNIVTGRIEWSDGLAEACGLPPGGFGGTIEAFQALIHPDDRSRVEAAIGRVQYGDEAYDIEFRMLRADGGERWVVARATVQRDGTGRPVRMVGIDFDITDRKAAEAALRRRKQELIRVQRLTGVAGLTWDPRTDRSTWSPEFLAMYGLPPDAGDCTYAAWRTHIHPDDRLGVDRALAAAIDGRTERYTAEYRVIRPGDGSLRWIAALGDVERDAAGRAVLLHGAHLDITERKASEAALAESEARFRGLAEAIPAFVFAAGPDGRNIYSNTRIQEYSGFSAEALRGDGWLATVHPSEVATIGVAWGRALASGTPYRAVHRLRRHDGAWRRFEVRVEAERDRDGVIRRWIGTCIDIDELRRAESALARTEQELRLAIEAAALGTWSCAGDGAALDASPRCRELYELPPGEPLTCERLALALHQDDREPTASAIQAALADRRDLDIEHRVLLPGGGVRWLRARGRAEFGEDGAVPMLRGVTMDIDVPKRAEQALREDNARLEERVAERTRALSRAAAELTAEMRRREEAQAALIQAQKLEALGQLTSGVAHDFNNVLTAVMGSLQLIGRRAANDPAILRLTRNGERAADRAAALIRQLLAFARQEDMAPAAIDPAATLAGMDDLMRAAVGAGVRVLTTAAPGVWPTVADTHQLEMALLNLAVNARDAMDGSGELAVSARNATLPARGDDAGPSPAAPCDGNRDGTDPDAADDDATDQDTANPPVAGRSDHGEPDEAPPGLRRPGDYVVFSVRDTGRGMTPEVLARATEAFFTTKPPGRGTGLGLAMVQTVARRLSGGLRLASTPGAGTTVELWLPRASGLAPPAPQVTDTDAAGHGGAKVLVVDDDELVRLVTTTLLRDLGYEVLEAGSAEMGLVQALAAERLDLVVADVTMPGGDGPSLAARLRAERPGLPVLFVTGYAGSEALAGEAVLLKPFTPAQLGERLLVALGRLRPADRLLPRLRRPELRAAYLTWLRLRGPVASDGRLPLTGALDPAGLTGGEHAFVVAVEDAGPAPPRLRIVCLGAALAGRFGQSLEGTLVEAEDGPEDAFGGQAEAYRRCVRFGVPCYDYTRFRTDGETAPVLFERLLLPLADDGGTTVTHLLGLALFSEPL